MNAVQYKFSKSLLQSAKGHLLMQETLISLFLEYYNYGNLFYRIKMPQNNKQ